MDPDLVYNHTAFAELSAVYLSYVLLIYLLMYFCVKHYTPNSRPILPISYKN